MVTKKIPAKTVKKAPAKLAVKKTVAVKKSVTKVVRAPKPAAKTVEKGTASREAPKAGVRMLKKVQTAEGWKREALKQNQVKKQTK